MNKRYKDSYCNGLLDLKGFGDQCRKVSPDKVEGSWCRTGLAVATGAVVGILLYELLRKKEPTDHTVVKPLIDTITINENGVLSRIITFGWNNDEVCSWAKEITLDAQGNIDSEKLIELEYNPDHILISESNGEEDRTPVLSTVLLNEFGMATAVTRRSNSGRESRWDEEIRGAERQRLVSANDETLYDWADGNVITISHNGKVTQKMTYYKSVENHLFPDLNHLTMGLSSEMILSHILGTRTRHFLSTVEIVNEETISHYAFSYLFDSEERPLHIHRDLTVIKTSGGESESVISHTDFDIKYVVI